MRQVKLAPTKIHYDFNAAHSFGIIERKEDTIVYAKFGKNIVTVTAHPQYVKQKFVPGNEVGFFDAFDQNELQEHSSLSELKRPWAV